MAGERAPGPRADLHWMRRALVLARRHAGRTWPNPTVGACLVRDGRHLADGVHVRAGEDHAEVAALEAAAARGIDPSGATLYVTLEPCHHEGRTPPCSRAIAAAGVSRVVYAVADDGRRNPGGGGAWLRATGIRVESGLLGREAWELNHPFFETRGDADVHVTLKLALSLDGRLGARRGAVEDPALRSVTGEAAHRRVHRMRAGASAVLVGRVTAQVDRPRLDVRLLASDRWQGPGPRPVILDPELALEPAALPPASLVLHREDAAAPARFAAAGHEPVAVEADGRRRLLWPGILGVLAARGLGILLVEGGGEVAGDLLAAGAAHRVHLFVAPRFLGSEGPGLAGPAGFERSYGTLRTRRVGDDLEWVLRRRDLPTGPE